MSPPEDSPASLDAPPSLPPSVSYLEVDEEDEDTVPITGLGKKLLQLESDQQFQKKKKKRSFHIDALKIVEENDNEADKHCEPIEDSKDDDLTTPLPVESPRLRKRVRFLGFDEVLNTPNARTALAFNSRPLPPPPLPPDFFQKQPDVILPQGLPPPPPPQPTPNSLPFVPRPPPLIENFTLTAAPQHPAEPTSLVSEQVSAADISQPIFTPAFDGDTHINRKAFRLYTKFVDEIAEFVRLQVNVTRKRVEAQERRAMQSKQCACISQHDAELLKGLRLCMKENTLEMDEGLSKLFEASQKARDDIIPLEEHYEALELELGAAEYALAEKFGALELRYENFFKLHGTSMSTSLAQSSISFESTEPEPAGESVHQKHDMEPQSLMHGAVIGAAVKVGQTPIQISYEPQAPSVVPHSPPQGPRLKRSDGSSEPLEFSRRQVLSIESMANYNLTDAAQESREQHITESIRGIGHISAYDDYDMALGPSNVTVDLHTFSESLIAGNQHNISTGSMYAEGENLLLLGSDGDTQSTLSDYLMRFDSTRDRINRWMLHKLRVSPREVFELQRKVESAHHDVPDWTSRALDMWDKDGIGYGARYTPGSEESEDDFVRISVPRPYPSTPPKQIIHKRPGSNSQIPQEVFLSTFDDELRNISKKYTDTAPI